MGTHQPHREVPGRSRVCNSLFLASPWRGRGGSGTGLCWGKASLTLPGNCSPPPGYKRQQPPGPEHKCPEGSRRGDGVIQPGPSASAFFSGVFNL